MIGMITIVKGHLFSDGTFSDGMITILKGHLLYTVLERYSIILKAHLLSNRVGQY